MRSNLIRLALPAFGAVALLASGAGRASAQQQTLRCESHGYDRNYCQADVRGSVQLVRQLSSASCARGRTWGTVAGRGVWVSNGCRADFTVGAYNNGNTGWNGNRNGNNNGRWNRNGNMNNGAGSVAAVRASGLCQSAIQRQVRRETAQLSEGTYNRRGEYVINWRTSRESGTCRVDANRQVMLTRNR